MIKLFRKELKSYNSFCPVICKIASSAIIQKILQNLRERGHLFIIADTNVMDALFRETELTLEAEVKS